MSEVMWSALAQYPNAGQGFADAFQQGMQRNALSALALNPTDPRAQAAAAPFAPGQVMQARQQQAELTQQEHDAWVKTLASAAKMADTPEKWDAAVDYFVSHGHAEAAQFKGKFSPGLRAAFMAQGGIADDKPAQGTAMQQNYGFLQGIDSKLADQYLHNQAEGAPLIASNGDGTFTIIPRSMAAQQTPSPGTVVPDPRLQGGPAATPPATFP